MRIGPSPQIYFPLILLCSRDVCVGICGIGNRSSLANWVRRIVLSFFFGVVFGGELGFSIKTLL